MDDWRWVYKRNELINRIENYRESHPEDREIVDFLLEVIRLFNMIR